MSQIAATAVVDKDAKLGEGVVIGPGCIIESGSVIGDYCELRGNVYIGRGTTLGKNNRVFANCVLGEEPQVLSQKNPETVLMIGDNNVFRESVTISRGSPGGGGKTVVGDDNYFMIGSHLGHDYTVEHHAVIGNYSQLGGHGKLEHHAWLSAFTATHQFVTIGRYAYTAGYVASSHDIPPYVRASGGYPCEVRGLNLIGLQRAGMDAATLKGLDQAYRALYRRGGPRNMSAAVAEQLQRSDQNEAVRYFLESIQRSLTHRYNRYLETFRVH